MLTEVLNDESAICKFCLSLILQLNNGHELAYRQCLTLDAENLTTHGNGCLGMYVEQVTIDINILHLNTLLFFC